MSNVIGLMQQTEEEKLGLVYHIDESAAVPGVRREVNAVLWSQN